LAKRGIEGMLQAIQYAREQKVPYFGICLGMANGMHRVCAECRRPGESQLSEFDPATPHRVII